jgi:hypothetical protein
MWPAPARLLHHTPVSITVEAIITDHDLSLIGNMGGNSGNEIQVVHLNLIVIGLTMPVYDLALVLVE